MMAFTSYARNTRAQFRFREASTYRPFPSLPDVWFVLILCINLPF